MAGIEDATSLETATQRLNPRSLRLVKMNLLSYLGIGMSIMRLYSAATILLYELCLSSL